MQEKLDRTVVRVWSPIVGDVNHVSIELFSKDGRYSYVSFLTSSLTIRSNNKIMAGSQFRTLEQDISVEKRPADFLFCFYTFDYDSMLGRAERIESNIKAWSILDDLKQLKTFWRIESCISLTYKVLQSGDDGRLMPDFFKEDEYCCRGPQRLFENPYYVDFLRQIKLKENERNPYLRALTYNGETDLSMQYEIKPLFYKSFFERHYYIGFAFLSFTFVGLFYIPRFTRWWNAKNNQYNKLFCEYIVGDNAASELIKNVILIHNNLSIIIWTNNNQNYLQITDILEEEIVIYELIERGDNNNKRSISKRILTGLLKTYLCMEQAHIDIVWDKFCRELGLNPEEKETVFSPKIPPTRTMHAGHVMYNTEISQENLERALARMAQYKAQLGLPPDLEGYIPPSLVWSPYG